MNISNVRKELQDLCSQAEKLSARINAIQNVNRRTLNHTLMNRDLNEVKNVIFKIQDMIYYSSKKLENFESLVKRTQLNTMKKINKRSKKR